MELPPSRRRDPDAPGPTGDRFFQAAVVVWIVAVLPSLVPLLPGDLTFTWANELSDVPALALIV